MADSFSAAGEQASNGDTSSLAAEGSVVPAAVVTVNIKTLNGPDFELAVEQNVLVSELKTKVRERTDVNEARQRLIYRGKVLADTEPLSTYKVEDGHFVHMVARPPGVPAPSAMSAGAGTAAAGSSANGDSQATVGAGTVPPPLPVPRPRTGARGERTLGEHLLMGMGLPHFAQGEGGGDAEGDNAHANAGGSIGSGNFLSDILALGTDNARPLHRARGARADRREPGSGGGTGSAAASSGTDGQVDMEHVRQGLLTLRTLLSSSTVRREAAQVRAAGAERQTSETTRGQGGPGAGVQPAEYEAEIETRNSGAADTSQASIDAADGPNLRAPVATAAEGGAELSMMEKTADVCLEQQADEASAAPKRDYVGKGVSSPGRIGLSPTPFDAESEEGGRDAERKGARAEGSQGTTTVEAHSQSPRLGGSAPSPRLLSRNGERISRDGALDSWERCYDDDVNGEGVTDGAGNEAEEEKEDRSGVVRESPDPPVTRRFFVGQWLDVKDTVNNWLEATVMDMADSGAKLQIHYNGWPPRWDEWLSWDSPRIAPFRTRTQHLPHSQHVSPAPISAVRNAPITGMDDVRVVMPEVSRVLQEISPMVEELSGSYARNLEQDPSNSPIGERAVSHTLPWTRQRFQLQEQGEQAVGASASVETESGVQAADLAGEIAPLLDRLGRMLTDVAPHLARLSAQAQADRAEVSAPERATGERGSAVEPGELPRRTDRRQAGLRRGDARRSRESSRRGGANGRTSEGVEGDNAAAFRQLVSTSSPVPTSSNINIHIHAIVPLRAPPSPPPPPPPPTASASTEATPTRGDRPPLAVAGSRNQLWGGSLDNSTSLIAAARAAAASRAAAAASARDISDGMAEAVTPRRPSGGIVADSGRSGGERDATGAGAGGGSMFDRTSSMGSSVSFDVGGVSASPLGVSTPGSSATNHSEPAPTPSTLSSLIAAGDPIASSVNDDDPGGDAGSTGPGGGGGNRRGGPWRGLLRALGVGNGNMRVSGRRDGVDGDQNA